MNTTEPLVILRDLVKHYHRHGFLRPRAPIRAVDGVSFEVSHGETLALVGETGSGKSTLARTVLRLEPATGGSVVFEGQDILTLPPRPLRALRRKMQIVFQDPSGALNPRMTVGASIAEGLLPASPGHELAV